jgi:drug/metabolite transporter (DMT)-like permease
MPSLRLRGIGYSLAGSLMFGLGAVLAQILGREIDVTIIAIAALSLGGLLLALGLALSGTSLFRLPALTRSDWVQLLLLAGPGTTLPLLLIVSGLSLTGALEGGFIIQLNGVAALIFAFLFLGERIRWRQGIGIILLLVGSALVVWSGANSGASSNSGVGDALILAGALGIGFGYIPAKHLSSRFASLPLTALRLLLGAVMVLPILAFELLLGSSHRFLWNPAPATLWIALPIYILANFCLAYLLQQEGLRLLMAWEVAAIMQTTPLFSAILAVLLLHDTMTTEQALGGLMAVAGGLIVSVPEKGKVRLREKETADSALPARRS